jgi:predicted acetyltransferase
MVEIEPITDSGFVALTNLCMLATYDLSELNGARISENGTYFKNNTCQQWLDDPNYELYFIRVDGELAGFVVVRYIEEDSTYYLNHFFVVRKHRRKQIGKEAAKMAFNKHEGKWRVSQFEWNIPAQVFWRKVVQEYTNNRYQETRRKDDKGPMQEFTRAIRL